MNIATFLQKNGDHPKRIVDFLRERDTFRNKIMEIVEHFDEEESYNNNSKPWKSSRILRVKPNFFIFSLFIIFLFFIFSCSFLYFFHFSLFFIFLFFIFLHFSFFFFFMIFLLHDFSSFFFVFLLLSGLLEIRFVFRVNSFKISCNIFFEKIIFLSRLGGYPLFLFFSSIFPFSFF